MATAKELIETANHLGLHRTCECDPSVGIMNCMGCDVARLAGHILATVREDNDESVTRERLETDGWEYDESDDCWRHPSHTMHFTTNSQYRNVLWFCVGSAVKVVKSMGHLRRLVAALGE